MKLLLLSLLCLTLPLSAAECRLTMNTRGEVSFYTEKGYHYKLFWKHKLTDPGWFSSFLFETIGEDRVLTFTNVWKGSRAFYQMQITPFHHE